MAKAKQRSTEPVMVGKLRKFDHGWELYRSDDPDGNESNATIVCAPWVKKLGLKKSGTELWWAPLRAWDGVIPDALFVVNDGYEIQLFEFRSGTSELLSIEVYDLEESAQKVSGLGYLYTKEPTVCSECGRPLKE